MSTKAIDRIKGYCTKVNQSQWEELVRVADEVGVGVWSSSRNMEVCKKFNIAFTAESDKDLILTYKGNEGTRTFIPFPDFIAKLRGEWMPKAGEMVEVDLPDRMWTRAEFVGMHGPFHVCFVDGEAEIDMDSYFGFNANDIRPLRPTITRAEAEQKLGKRIID